MATKHETPAKPHKRPGGERETSAPTTHSATDMEKVRLDDDAVRRAVNVAPPAQGLASVLPGPPIPPEKQAEIAGEDAEPRDAAPASPSKTRKPSK